MIHPSTMAGPNWFTGNFGTTNPFQQNTSPFFRNTPFQGGFGFGNNPFQNPTFGFNTTPFQNTINEIVRQTIPTMMTNYGFQPTNGFQIPIGFQTPTGPAQFGPQFQNTPFGFNNPTFNDWQNPNFISEIIRQATNQAIQNVSQTMPGTFFGLNPTQQQNILNLCTQICQQACQQVCQTTCQAIATCATTSINQQNTSFNPTNPFTANTPQNILNLCGQICLQACQQQCQTVCQAVFTCAAACINQQTTSFNTTNPLFNTQNTPFNFNTTTPQFSFTSGIPTGVGAF